MFLINCIIIFVCAEYGKVLKGEAQGMGGGGLQDQDRGFYSTLLKKLSHLSAHVVERLLRENQMTIPKFLSGKKLLRNETLQILNFIPVS